MKINDVENKSKVQLKANEQKVDSFYKISMGFQGHYGEPDLDVIVPRSLLVNSNGCVRLEMIYNPIRRRWDFVMSYNYFTKEDLEIIVFKDGRDANVK